MGAPVTHKFRVRYADCDMQGVVFNGNYVTYVDDAVTELWRAAFGSYSRMTEAGLDVMVVEILLGYSAPARFDEMLEIDFGVVQLGRTSMTSSALVRRGDDELCSVRIVHVFVDSARHAPVEIPAWIRDGLAPFTVGDEAPAPARTAP